MQTSKDSFLIPKGGSFQSKEGSCKLQKMVSSILSKGFQPKSKEDSCKLLKDSFFIPRKGFQPNRKGLSLSPKRLFFTPKDIVLYPKDVDSNLEGVCPTERGVASISRCFASHSQYFYYDLNKESTNSFLSKSCKSSIFSPSPIYFTGTFNWSEIPITTPPLAVPSSLVMARLVICVTALN